MADTKGMFQVSGDFFFLLPRFSTSFWSEDVQGLPVLQRQGSKCYLIMKVSENREEVGAIWVDKRVPMEDVSETDVERINDELSRITLAKCRDGGLETALTEVTDDRIRALCLGLMTFLDTPEVKVVLALYQMAAEQGSSPRITVKSNELLERLGYKRNAAGYFEARVRGELKNRLDNLHSVELHFARSTRKGQYVDTDVEVRNILRIKRYRRRDRYEDYDPENIRLLGYELADEYELNLEFFEWQHSSSEVVLIADSVDLGVGRGNPSKSDKKFRLLMYLASRLKKQNPENGVLTISKSWLIKYARIDDSNTSRRSETLRKAIDALIEEGFVLHAYERPVEKKGGHTFYEIKVNPERIRLEVAGDAEPVTSTEETSATNPSGSRRRKAS